MIQGELDIDTAHWEQYEQDGRYHEAQQVELESLKKKVQELTQLVGQLGSASSGQTGARAEKVPTAPS